MSRMRARLSPFKLLDPAAEPASKEKPSIIWVHVLRDQAVYLEPVGLTSPGCKPDSSSRLQRCMQVAWCSCSLNLQPQLRQQLWWACRQLFLRSCWQTGCSYMGELPPVMRGGAQL